jgi:CPA1 family monovalent cation:H+ antiporter
MPPWVIALFVASGVVARLIEPHMFSRVLGPAALALFLPALLFEAAWNLEWPLLAKHWKPIALLAVPGVFVTAAVVALVCVLAGLPASLGLLLGAMLSATDPVAVVTIFRRLHAPRGLATIVEGEALFNDGVAVVLYRTVLAMIVVGAAAPQQTAIAAQALLGSAAGVLIGVAGALIVGRVLTSESPAGVRIVATLACAYATYIFAEYVHASGIFATIAAGITLAHSEEGEAHFAIDRRVDGFWVGCAAVANAILFFLVGATLDPQSILRQPYVAVVTLVAIVLGRAVLAYVLLPIGMRAVPNAWKAVVGAAMMRGALCIALAINLPAALPYRGILIDVTFTVVAATLMVMFFGLPAVARRVADA